MKAFIQSHLDCALAPAGTSFLTSEGAVVATGGFGWLPATFWAATLTEFHAALRGRDVKADKAPSITPADARRTARAAGYKIFGEDD